jgi:hypothetical protein
MTQVRPSGWTTKVKIVIRANAVSAGGGHAWGSITVFAVVVRCFPTAINDEVVAGMVVVVDAVVEDDNKNDAGCCSNITHKDCIHNGAFSAIHSDIVPETTNRTTCPTTIDRIRLADPNILRRNHTNMMGR